MNNQKELDRVSLIKAKINPFSDEVPIDEVMVGICACVLGITIYFFTESVVSSITTIALLYWIEWSVDKRYQRVAYIATYRFPDTIKVRVGQHYPHLSDDQLSLVIYGLRQYLQLCNTAVGITVSMPSRVVDVAWHEFILFTKDYKEFCQHGIGHFLHHVPAEGMKSASELDEGMKKAWFLACQLEGIDHKAPSQLPLLFSIDETLKIPDGCSYSLDNDYATAANNDISCGGCGGC